MESYNMFLIGYFSNITTVIIDVFKNVSTTFPPKTNRVSKMLLAAGKRTKNVIVKCNLRIYCATVWEKKPAETSGEGSRQRWANCKRGCFLHAEETVWGRLCEQAQATEFGFLWICCEVARAQRKEEVVKDKLQKNEVMLRLEKWSDGVVVTDSNTCLLYYMETRWNWN